MAKEFGNKSSTKVLLYLVAITVIYQGMYHICITLPFSMSEPYEYAPSAAIHPCNGAQSTSQQCMESALFKNWEKLQSTDLDEAEVKGKWIGEDVNGPDLLALDPIGRALLGSDQSVSVEVRPNRTNTALEPAPVPQPAVQPKEPVPPAVVVPELESQAEKSTGFAVTTKWGGSLIQLETQLEALKEKYESKRRVASSSLKAHVNGVKDRSLVEKIDDLLREMCEDPQRRDRPTCAKFLTSKERHDIAKAKLHSGLSALAKGRLEWERSFVHRAKGIGKQLCADQKRQGDAVCDPFRTEVPTSAPGRILSMAFARDATTGMLGLLQGKRQAQPTEVDHRVLRASKWAGKIPKVACIMAVPNSARAHARVKYAINNFRGQTYEGPTQLVMVYHHEDKETAHLLKRFADGVYIKALAARTDVPSTTALRYGAWAAGNDTDVVARWDLDTWHHPHRLEMQVRSLGLTGLPVSLLKRRTLVADDGHAPVMYLEGGFQGNSSAGFGWPESLVAERTWVEKNWMPALKSESNSLGASPGLVTLLDMPELQAYSSDDSLVHDTASERLLQKNKEHELVPATP